MTTPPDAVERARALLEELSVEELGSILHRMILDEEERKSIPWVMEGLETCPERKRQVLDLILSKSIIQAAPSPTPTRDMRKEYPNAKFEAPVSLDTKKFYLLPLVYCAQCGTSSSVVKLRKCGRCLERYYCGTEC
jgi:hypothetical protein